MVAECKWYSWHRHMGAISVESFYRGMAELSLTSTISFETHFSKPMEQAHKCFPSLLYTHTTAVRTNSYNYYYCPHKHTLLKKIRLTITVSLALIFADNFLFSFKSIQEITVPQ